MPASQYAGLTVTPEAATALRVLSLRLGAEAGRRVPMAEALTVACQVTGAHLAEAIQHIRGEHTS